MARRIDDTSTRCFETTGPAFSESSRGRKTEDDAKEKALNLETVLETHADAPTSPQALRRT